MHSDALRRHARQRRLPIRIHHASQQLANYSAQLETVATACRAENDLRRARVAVENEVAVRRVGEHAHAAVHQLAVSRGEKTAQRLVQRLGVGIVKFSVQMVGVGRRPGVVVDPKLQPRSAVFRKAVVVPAASAEDVAGPILDVRSS